MAKEALYKREKTKDIEQKLSKLPIFAKKFLPAYTLLQKGSFHTKKLGRFIAVFEKYGTNNSQNCQFWQK